MRKIIEINDGKGILNLKGDPTHSILYINKTPIQFCFFAEVGTVWRYHAGIENSFELFRNLYQYENFVENGIIDGIDNILEGLKPIIKLLANGKYEIRYCEFPFFNKIPATDIYNENVIHDYYEVGAFTATQNYISEKIVGNYIRLIKDGNRPIPILFKLKDSNSIYIIDGHHKLEAYENCKINPNGVIISKLDNYKIESEDTKQLMKKMGFEKEHFDLYERELETNNYNNWFYKLYKKGSERCFKDLIE